MERRDELMACVLYHTANGLKERTIYHLPHRRKHADKHSSVTCDRCTSTTLSTCVRPLVSVCNVSCGVQPGRLRLISESCFSPGRDRHEVPSVCAETRLLCNSRIHDPPHLDVWRK